MKRRLGIIFTACLCIFCLSILSSATEVNPLYLAGTYFDQANQTDLQKTNFIETDGVVAIYDGEEISQAAIEYQRNMNIMRDAETASTYQTNQDIINNIVKNMMLLEEAERQGLTATQEEIDEMMDNAYMAYEIPEGKAMIDAYCDGAGLTTDEYFSLLREQIPDAIARQKLKDAIGMDYCEENGISPLKFHHLPRGVIGCY